MQTPLLSDTEKTLLLERYAQLIVRYGMNVQEGQLVNVGAELCHSDLVTLITKEAYKAGAKLVIADYIDPKITRARIEHSNPEFITEVPHFLTTKYNELVDSGAASVRLDGPFDPEALTGLDPVLLNNMRRSIRKSAEYYYEEGIRKFKIQWLVAAAATPGWAKKVFPDLEPQTAYQKLWLEIFKATRVTEANFLELWKAHDDVLHTRRAKLTAQRIKRVIFKGPGTDLSVGLTSKSVFKGGSDLSANGVRFQPNIPTEEVYTTPDYRLTEGHARVTRPILVNGTIIRGLVLNFRAGKLVSFTAESGAPVFEQYISSDAGARRLGELALVGTDSPIYKSGALFEQILFDENAACHIAIGMSYSDCIQGGTKMTAEELDKLGCNDSSTHLDMMISDSQTEVYAELESGDKIDLLKSGAWCQEWF